jgi:hypothetical protein
MVATNRVLLLSTDGYVLGHGIQNDNRCTSPFRFPRLTSEGPPGLGLLTQPIGVI